MAVRQKTAPSSTELRRLVDEEILAPLAEKFDRAEQRQTAIPKIVFENRRKRARQRISDALVSRGSRRFPSDLKRDVRELFRRWAEQDFEDGFAPALEFEIQAARERDLAIALESGDRSEILKAHERAYRARVIERHGRIELRGVQTSHRVLLDLEQIYVPLHLEEAFRANGAKPGGKAEPIPPGLGLRVSLPAVLEAERRILVVGGPGSGKSTLAAYLSSGSAADPKAAALPLPLMVRQIRNPDLSVAGIAEQLECDQDVVKVSLEQRRALLILDGLDEAPPELRQRLTSQLKSLAKNHPGLRIVVTSRPAGSPGEIEESLCFLYPYRIADFNRSDIENFVDRWCLAAETSIRADLAAAEKAAKKAATDLKQRIESNRSVQRIAANPLLATILCIVHRFLAKIPERRATLYERCTDALLYEWDQAKFPERTAMAQLDAPAKRRLLMGVARQLHENHSTEIARDEVVKIFAKSLPELGRSSRDSESLASEIRDRSGLLVEYRAGWFAFSHLSFQEYFTALDFVRTKEVKKLATRRSNPWWQEVILLGAGVPGADSGEIVEALLDHRDRTAIVLAARCLETTVDLPLKVRRRVENALAEIVPPRDYQEAKELAMLGQVVAPLLARSLPKDLSNGEWDPKWTLTIVAMTEIDYEPSIPILMQVIRRPERTGHIIPFEEEGKVHVYFLTLGELVTLTLSLRASGSRMAYQALRRALEVPRSFEFLLHLRSLGIRRTFSSDVKNLIEAALKEAPREKPPSKPAPNTA